MPLYPQDLISIIIPCRNEERFIRDCIDSVLAFDIPDGYRTEIFVVDGMSFDRTLEIVTQLAEHHPDLEVIENPGIYQSFAINLALERAGGGWIMRLDAHSHYPEDYLKLCLETAMTTGADNVGGLLNTIAGSDSYQGQLVQALTTHPFGVGDSGFRTGAGEGPVDTVPFGFFRRDLFDRIGRMDERLIRAQDYEFNRRIIATGGKVWRNPGIQVNYINQPTLSAFYRKQLFKEAPYNAYLWYVAPYAFTLRHAITGAFAAGMIGGVLLSPLSNWIAWPFLSIMLLYSVLAITSGIQQAVRYRKPGHVIALPPLFFLYHFIHGLGVLWGLIRLVTGTAPVQNSSEPWPGAGRFRALSDT